MSATLSTFDLVMTSFSAVVLPLIVYLNIRQREAPSTPFAAYMWQSEWVLTVTGLAFLSLLAIFSMLDLAVHFGLVGRWISEVMLPILGVPAALTALGVLVLGGRAALRAWRRST